MTNKEKMIKLDTTIQKRLKVLEILKEKAFLYVNVVNKDVKSIQITITTCDDRFKQIEEWLDEE